MRHSEVSAIMELRKRYYGEFIEGRFKRILSKKPESIMIAEDDETIGGYAFFQQWHNDTLIVPQLYAFSDKQKEIEKHLLNHLERHSQKSGVSTIRLWVKEEQKSLIKDLYNRNYELEMELIVFANDDVATAPIGHWGNQNIDVVDFKEIYLDDLLAIEKSCFKPAWRQDTRDFLKKNYAQNWFSCAMENDKVVGYLQISAGNDVGYLGRIAVLPGFQRRGIGTRLAACAMKWFKGQHIKKVRLRSSADNVPAHKLYHKFGFKELGREYDFTKKMVSSIDTESNM